MTEDMRYVLTQRLRGSLLTLIRTRSKFGCRQLKHLLVYGGWRVSLPSVEVFLIFALENYVPCAYIGIFLSIGFVHYERFQSGSCGGYSLLIAR